MYYRDSLEVEHFKHNGYLVVVRYDDDPENPRTMDCRATGTIIMNDHKVDWRCGEDDTNLQELYLALGDRIDQGDPTEVAPYIPRYFPGALVVPLYDSGWRLTLGAPTNDWKARGIDGIVYVLPDELRREFEHRTDKHAAAIDRLADEISTYSAYLYDGVYELLVYNAEGEIIEGIGNIYGYDESREELAKDIIGSDRCPPCAGCQDKRYLVSPAPAGTVVEVCQVCNWEPFQDYEIDDDEAAELAIEDGVLCTEEFPHYVKEARWQSSISSSPRSVA